MYDTGINMPKDNPLPVLPSFLFFILFYVWSWIVGVAERGRISFPF